MYNGYVVRLTVYAPSIEGLSAKESIDLWKEELQRYINDSDLIIEKAQAYKSTEIRKTIITCEVEKEPCLEKDMVLGNDDSVG